MRRRGQREGGSGGGRVCGGWEGFASKRKEGRARRKSTSEDYGNDIRFFSLSSSCSSLGFVVFFPFADLFLSFESTDLACLSSFTFLSLFFTFSLFLLPLPLAENVLEKRKIKGEEKEEEEKEEEKKEEEEKKKKEREKKEIRIKKEKETFRYSANEEY